jgi:hypothetical protein
VRAALQSLPWVEHDSITTDVPSRRVTFAVKDKNQFDLVRLKEAFKQQNYDRVELVSGPDTPAPSKEP